mmetsp:Transcript_11729/g.33869  ORF Transcript_11729/g.33869 Transcript_11729/m.33869 type:complete len:128 (-) Transcript_11729:102-485(-)
MRNCEMSDDVIGAATYCFGDYGVPAGVAPFMVQSMVQTHYDGGAFFPRGGAGSIGKAVTRAIQRRGGKVLVRAPVSKIVVKGGRAVAVESARASVSPASKHGVISAAGANNTFEKKMLFRDDSSELF